MNRHSSKQVKTALRAQVMEPHAVSYQWSSGGIICHSSSVTRGKDRRDAERRFFRQQASAQPEEVEA